MRWKMENCAFLTLNENELIDIDGGSFWKYLGAGATIAFGVYEIYTGIGAVDGKKELLKV